MDQKTFEREMRRAGALKSENPSYWAGYRRGLRSQHHDESFETMHGRTRWLLFYRKNWVRGYRDGYCFIA